MFAFLCQHKKRFGIPASWSFFASCHGKSSCDGNGGTLKRAAAKESLRRSADNPIENVKDLFEFCSSEHFKIKPILITSDEINFYRMNKKILNLRTLPGTRSLHYFQPLTDTIIRCKITSLDKLFTFNYDLVKNIKRNTVDESYTPMAYVAFVVYENWLMSQVISVNEEEKNGRNITYAKI